MLTRRETTTFLLAGAAAAVLPKGASAASADKWRAALEQALDAATVPGAGTRLTLRKFGLARQGGRTGMAAVVAMDWRPGHRSRRFDVSEAGEQAAFKRLVSEIVGEFGAANTDGVRAVRFR